MIVICGDSFATPDPEYGPCWVDLLGKNVNTLTLAEPGASNLMINLQVRHAITLSAYIIVTFTSSTRDHVVVRPEAEPHQRLRGYSYPAMDNIRDLPEYPLLRKYNQQCFDLSSAIVENQCVIDSTLNTLQRSGAAHIWSQGGFEHPMYGGTSTYFEHYAETRSDVNLWDWAPNRAYRPYYHVTDPDRHQYVADYYYNAYQQTRHHVLGTLDTHVSKPAN